MRRMIDYSDIIHYTKNTTCDADNNNNLKEPLLNRIPNISIMNVQNYLKIVSRGEKSRLIINNYNPTTNNTIATNNNHYTKLPKHQHEADSHKTTNRNQILKRNDQPVVYEDRSSKISRKEWTPTKYASIISLVRNNRKPECKNIDWKYILSLWKSQHPNDTAFNNLSDETAILKLKTLHLTASRKHGDQIISNNVSSSNNSAGNIDLITLNDYHNNESSNLNDDLTSNLISTNNFINCSENNNIIAANNINQNFTNYNTTAATTTTTNNNNNINNINNHTTLRDPKHKQPFSPDEVKILVNALESYYKAVDKNKSIKWDSIYYIYNTEATNQYIQDNSKPIFARTKQQLEEKYKISIKNK